MTRKSRNTQGKGRSHLFSHPCLGMESGRGSVKDPTFLSLQLSAESACSLVLGSLCHATRKLKSEVVLHFFSKALSSGYLQCLIELGYRATLGQQGSVAHTADYWSTRQINPSCYHFCR
jgi:hypothetical protein